MIAPNSASATGPKKSLFKPLATVLTALCLVGVGVGCTEPVAEEPASPPPQPSNLTLDMNPAPQQAPPPGVPVPMAEPQAEVVDAGGSKLPPLTPESLAALNEAVAYYGLDAEGNKVRIPKDVDQLVREKFLLTPPVAPKGTKLIINQKSGLIEVVSAQ